MTYDVRDYDEIREARAVRPRLWWCDECHQSGVHARGCPNEPPEPEEFDDEEVAR